MPQSSLYKASWKEICIYLFTKDRYFQLGLIIKIIFSIFFASTYLTDLFVPFIKSATHDSFFNVYANMYAAKPDAFPYPPVMLYILAIPGYIMSLFTSQSTVTYFDIFLLRIPLIVGDILLLVILIKWLRASNFMVKWYWFNPVIFYVSYIHGQLDIIPTALFCLSLYYLFVNRLNLFVVFLALSCATKFHIIMAIPIIAIYLYRTRKLNLPQIIRLGLFFTVLLAALNMPFLLQHEYVMMVYNNKEQNKVFSAFYNVFSTYNILFIPATYMIILYIMTDFRFVNKDILLIFLAVSFGTITFFIVPSQGWYLWNMPLFVYFAYRFGFRAKVLFLLLNLAYFMFFIVFPASDFPLVAQLINPELRTTPNFYQYLNNTGINAELVVEIAFTILQTALFLFCVILFRLGILQTRRFKIYHQPYLIGICGDSGTGKSTLAKAVEQLFGSTNTLTVQGDDMHRWERGHQKWEELTHLNPKANWLHRDLANLIDLRAGKKIKRRLYNHSTGKFTEPVLMKPSKVIIYEGLHAFFLQHATQIYDLKIFMMPSEELRRLWKIARDVHQRGHSEDAVIQSIEKRMPDSISHIMNQQEGADIVFSIIKSINPDTPNGYALKVDCHNDVYFEGLLDCLKQVGKLQVQHDIDRVKQVMIIDGEISAWLAGEVADSLHLDIEELIGATPVWQDGYKGIMQLFILYYMLTQFKRTGMLVASETY